jgi:hypothetical protein
LLRNKYLFVSFSFLLWWVCLDVDVVSAIESQEKSPLWLQCLSKPLNTWFSLSLWTKVPIITPFVICYFCGFICSNSRRLILERQALQTIFCVTSTVVTNVQ